MDTEFKVVRNDQPPKKQVMFHERVRLTMVGQLAKELTHMLVVAMVASRTQGIPVAILSNDEIVEKCCNLAELFYEAAADRGMLIDVPALDELMKDDSSPPGFRAVAGR